MGIVEEVRELSDFVRKFNDIELNRRILSLENEVLDLSRGKRRLEQEVEELKSTLKFSKEMKFNGRFYQTGEDNHPFCPGCWDSRQQAIHLTIDPSPRVHFICPSCKHTYMP